MGMKFVFLALLLAAQTARPAFFQTPLTLDQMKGKQAVVETSMGTIVIQLLPEAAPNHVGHFIKLARDGTYTWSTDWTSCSESPRCPLIRESGRRRASRSHR